MREKKPLPCKCEDRLEEWMTNSMRRVEARKNQKLNNASLGHFDREKRREKYYFVSKGFPLVEAH